MSHHFNSENAANRKVVGSGQILCNGPMLLSNLITIPAWAMECAICGNDNPFCFTTDGVTPPSVSGKIGIHVPEYSTAFISGDDLIKNIRIDTSNKACYVEFYSSPGSIYIS